MVTWLAESVRRLLRGVIVTVSYGRGYWGVTIIEIDSVPAICAEAGAYGIQKITPKAIRKIAAKERML